MRALLLDRFGGPEVLEYREVPAPTLQPGHTVVRMEAIGLNFADVYRRRGYYHIAGSAPWILGYEGAGVIEACGEDAAAFGLAPGSRVGFADSPFANAELVAVPLEKLIPLPVHISDEVAAASLLQGLTAQYLARDSHPVRPGETAVVHAAAGGVGLLLTQIATLLGARVLGLTSSAAKARAVLQAGAAEVFLYDTNWVGRVKDATGGRGADVVYDSVGSTLEQSFEASRIGGQVVFFGMSGGDPPRVDPAMLMDTSRSLTGGDLWSYLTSREERLRRAGDLFEWLRAGAVRVHVGGRFALAEGAAAHALLESRRSSGKVLLIP